MRSLKYYVPTSVDGFIAHQDGSVGGFLTEGEHSKAYLESLKDFDTVLMGRATYEFGLQYGVTDPYPWLDSYVLSATMTASPDPRVRLVSSDALEFVARLKQQPGGDMYLCGGQLLASALLPLIDEVIVKLNPVLFGAGKSLFQSFAEPLALEFIGVERYDRGVMFLRYAVKR